MRMHTFPGQVVAVFTPSPCASERARARETGQCNAGHLRRGPLLACAVAVTMLVNCTSSDRSAISTTRPENDPTQLRTIRPQLILFDASGDESWDLYAVSIDGSGLVRLTDEPAPDFDGTCSPDGTRIAYRSERDGNPEIYVMNADGSGELDLTNDPATDYSPSWSPDGTQLAFASDRAGGTANDIYVMNGDGTDVRRVTDSPAIEEYPTWSPDGNRIAFANESTGEIWIVYVDGSGLRNLSSPVGDGTRDDGPAWSPDGTHIAFSSGPEHGRKDVYVMDVDGSHRTRLTASGGASPSWSPDGERIAYSWGSIYLMNRDGSATVRMAVEDLGELNLPDWC